MIRTVALALLASGFSMPAAAGSVTVEVSGLRNSDGVIRACLTRRADAFPRCAKDPGARRVIVPARSHAVIRFDDVSPGEYAIALLHDENENGKADRMLGMAPKEGYGFSRDAAVEMAPPAWKDAVFRVGTAPHKLAIRMRYFL